MKYYDSNTRQDSRASVFGWLNPRASSYEPIPDDRTTLLQDNAGPSLQEDADENPLSWDVEGGNPSEEGGDLSEVLKKGTKSPLKK